MLRLCSSQSRLKYWLSGPLQKKFAKHFILVSCLNRTAPVIPHSSYKRKSRDLHTPRKHQSQNVQTGIFLFLYLGVLSLFQKDILYDNWFFLLAVYNTDCILFKKIYNDSWFTMFCHLKMYFKIRFQLDKLPSSLPDSDPCWSESGRLSSDKLGLPQPCTGSGTSPPSTFSCGCNVSAFVFLICLEKLLRNPDKQW